MYQMNESKLMESGVFADRMSMVSFVMMKYIDQHDEPLGSGNLREKLRDVGIECSTATLGRYLKELDYKDYTVQRSNMGRIITPSGKAYLAATDEKLERSSVQMEVRKAVKVTDLWELLDLLHVRRALEVEAAKQAAEKATEEDKKRLLAAVSDHQQVVSDNQDPTLIALSFHNIVAEASHNRFLISILKMLVYEEEKLESRMETLLTRERGKIYVKEHEQIVNAIISKQADYAGELMDKHISALCDAVTEQTEME